MLFSIFFRNLQHLHHIFKKNPEFHLKWTFISWLSKLCAVRCDYFWLRGISQILLLFSKCSLIKFLTYQSINCIDDCIFFNDETRTVLYFYNLLSKHLLDSLKNVTFFYDTVFFFSIWKIFNEFILIQCGAVFLFNIFCSQWVCISIESNTE